MGENFKLAIKLVSFIIIFTLISGCSRNFNLKQKFQEEFKKSQDATVNVWENNKIKADREKTEALIKKGISEEAKAKIEKWVEKNDFNKYGDPKNLMYAGGTPLFNEATGVVIDRYEYILKNHPELVRELGLEN